MRLFDGACHSKELHYCSSRSHWPLWKRFFDWVIVIEQDVIVDGIDQNGNRVESKLAGRVYRHELLWKSILKLTIKLFGVPKLSEREMWLKGLK